MPRLGWHRSAAARARHSKVVACKQGMQWLQTHKTTVMQCHVAGCHVAELQPAVHLSLLITGAWLRRCPLLQEEHSRVVYIHDVCASSFRTFLAYMYSDALELDHYSVLDLLYLSRKYIMPHLTKQCTAYVRAHLSCANALQWLVWAREQVG
jgi:hypothetical protein